MPNPSVTQEGSRVGNLGKRAIAWLVLIAAAIIIVKIALGAIIGVIVTVLMIAAVVALIGAVFWALRHL
jgi:hypothetical protein